MVQAQSQDTKTTSLEAAIKQLLVAKEQAGRRKRTIKGLRIYLNQFSKGRESVPIDGIDVDALDKWFQERNEKPASKRSNIGRLSSLFSFAVRRGWMQSNPCNRLEKPILDKNPPKILTIEECEKVLVFARDYRPVFLPWLVLALFCGLRPESECDKVLWEHINLNEQRLTISGAGTKVRLFRIVDLSKTPAVPWLNYCREKKLRLGLSTKARSRYVKQMRDMLGWWVPDVLRHTAASYLCSHLGDNGKVAAMLGTSESMLHAHYRSLVSSESTKRFFQLTPENAKAHIEGVIVKDQRYQEHLLRHTNFLPS